MDHLRPKIFLHRFSGSLGHQGGGKEEVIIRPGALSSPLAGPSNPNSPTVQIDETRSAVKTTNCHILLAHNTHPTKLSLPKNQQDYEVVHKIPKLTHALVFTCLWKSGPWLLGGRWGCSSPRNLSVFSFVFCILGGGAMNDGYKWDEEAHLNLFTTHLTRFSHQHFYTTCIQNLWIFLVFVLGFFTTFLSSYMAFNLDPITRRRI